MLLVLLVAVVCSVVVWLAVRWARVRRFWADRGVVHWPPHPVLGSLTFLQRENPALWFRKLYDTFRKPYVGIWLFWRPALVINCPELARSVLVKDADNFRDHYFSSGKSDPVGSLHIFTVNDPIWTNLRRRMTPVFTAAKVRSFQGMVREKAADLTQRIETEMNSGNTFNLRMVLTDYTTDVVGESTFGVKSESTRTGDSVMRKVTREFMEFNIIRGLSWSFIFFLPEMVDLSRGVLSFFPKHTIEFLRQLYRGMVAQRGEVSEPRDLLDALIKMKQDAQKEGEEMSEDLLLAQAAILVLGGFDTSGAAFTMALYELAHLPHAQDKLYNELIKAKENGGKEDIDAALLSELPFLNAVIKETLRKFPPMGWLDRVAKREYKIDDNLTIPAGTAVYVNAMGLHNDPEYFPEPDRFKPDRFLPENEVHIKPFTYLPFGDGPRTCIGRRFGLQTLAFGLSAVVLKFQMRPPAGATLPNDVEFEKKGLFLMPIERLSIIFTKRD